MRKVLALLVCGGHHDADGRARRHPVCQSCLGMRRCYKEDSPECAHAGDACTGAGADSIEARVQQADGYHSVPAHHAGGQVACGHACLGEECMADSTWQAEHTVQVVQLHADLVSG